MLCNLAVCRQILKIIEKEILKVIHVYALISAHPDYEVKVINEDVRAMSRTRIGLQHKSGVQDYDELRLGLGKHKSQGTNASALP